MIPALILLAMIQVQQPAQPRLVYEPPQPAPASPANDIFYEHAPRADRQARQAIHAFGRCVAERSGRAADGVLRQDFTTSSQRQGLARLARSNERCYRSTGGLAFSHLLLTGAMAEHLLEQSGEPVNVLLARSLQRPAAPPFSPSDRIATCVVRSVPDQAASLLASEPASAEEAAAVATLRPAIGLCSGAGPRIEATDAGLRAILSAAAYRSVFGQNARTERD